jgi:hypothetical protein
VLRYWASRHAAERLMQRFKVASSEVEARRVLSDMAARAVDTGERDKNPSVSHLLDEDHDALLVVNKDRNVIITVYRREVEAS